MSPEVFANDGKPYDGTKCDVWGLGVTLLFLLVRNQALWTEPSIHNTQFTHLVVHGHLETFLRTELRVSSALTELLVSMLKHNPQERIACESILTHNWLRV